MLTSSCIEPASLIAQPQILVAMAIVTGRAHRRRHRRRQVLDLGSTWLSEQQCWQVVERMQVRTALRDHHSSEAP